jgi:hypothetical protein
VNVNLSTGELLAKLAGLSAALAVVAGFIPGVYRDTPSLIAQSHGQDLATLCVGLPVLFTGLRASAAGDARGRLLAQGALGYLLYTYVTYAFDAMLNPVTILYIAVVGCATWAFVFWHLQMEVPQASRLPRRTTAAFLFGLVVVFGTLWLSQMATAAITGVRPEALVEAGWPTSPIYVLDLAFVLPLCTGASVRLLRNQTVNALVVPVLVFVALLALGIVSISLSAFAAGQPLDAIGVVLFVAVATGAGILGWRGLTSDSSPLIPDARLHGSPARSGRG